jgi:uncharacterized protein (DUF58 family)
MRFLLRPLYLAYRVSSGLRYRARRRFTPGGWAVLGAFLVTGAMGLDTENSVTYQAFPVLLALLLIAAAFTPFFRGRFAVTRSLPRFATAGLPLTYRVVVQNLGRKTQRGLTLLEDLADPRPSFSAWLAHRRDEQKQIRPFRLSRRHRVNPFRLATAEVSPLSPIPRGQSSEAVVSLLPLRRGLLRFAGATLARPDPLGLLRSFVHVTAPQSLLILPRRYFIAPLALPGVIKYQPGGVALASNVGQSEEFVSLRDYRRGDPLRHIHWRSWAKVGRPIVKEFEDEFFVRHALVLDTFTDRLHSDEFEEAVAVAASFACALSTQDSLLDLLFVGPQAFCFTAGRGLAHVDQMLEILATVEPCVATAFDTLDHLVVNHAAAVSGCICVFLAWDKPRQQLVEKLKLLGLPLRVLVIQSAGNQKPLDAGPLRDAPGDLQALEVGKVEQQLARLTA